MNNYEVLVGVSYRDSVTVASFTFTLISFDAGKCELKFLPVFCMSWISFLNYHCGLQATSELHTAMRGAGITI